jgi:hypothetical protein
VQEHDRRRIPRARFTIEKLSPSDLGVMITCHENLTMSSSVSICYDSVIDI